MSAGTKVTVNVKDNNVERIVTGMHDGGDDSFLVMFNKLAPKTPITMVAKDNMVYSMELCSECMPVNQK